MGPWSEQRQLERAKAVARLLQQPGLSDWARQYWQTVLTRLATSEAQYNHRVEQTYSKLPRQKGWIDYGTQ